MLTERGVNARSSFLPFASNTWGTIGPSSDPVSDPLSTKRHKKRKKRRKSPEDEPEEVHQTSKRNEPKKRKTRKKLAKHSALATSVDTKTRNAAKPPLKKVKKRSRTAEANKGSAKRSYKGSRNEAVKKRSRIPSHEVSRNDEPRERVVETAESPKTKQHNMKRRRKLRASGSSTASGDRSKSLISRGACRSKNMRSKRRINPVGKPVVAPSSPPRDKRSTTHRRVKKKRTIKKHQDATVAVVAGTNDDVTLGSSVGGDREGVRSPPIAEKDLPVAPESVSSQGLGCDAADDDKMDTELPAERVPVTIQDKQEIVVAEIERNENKPEGALGEQSAKSIFLEATTVDVDTEDKPLAFYASTSNTPEVVPKGTIEDDDETSSNEHSAAYLGQDPLTAREEDAVDAIVDSSESNGKRFELDAVSLVDPDDIDSADASSKGATKSAVNGAGEVSIETESDSDTVAEVQGTIGNKIVQLDSRAISTENRALEAESVIASQSASDVSETDEEATMEEYNPDLLEKGGESSENESAEEYEPGLLDNVEQDPSSTVASTEDSNYLQGGRHATEEGPDKTTSKAGNANVEQDVVDFIEEILQEDVRSWVNETSSDCDGSNDTLNGTRGGQQIGGISPEEEFDKKGSTHEPDDDSDDTGDVEEEGRKSSLENDQESEQTATVTDVSNENPPKESIVEADERTDALASAPLDLATLESREDCDSDIAVSVVTWNLAESSPSTEDAAFIRKFRKAGVRAQSGSDLVLISGQECENIKPRRSEGSRSREYRRLMIKMLGKQYVPIALHLLGGIQFGLFAKKSFLKEIEEIAIADVTCGIGNVFHNKGAIAAFLKVKARNQLEGKKSKSLRMVFVTAHLAAHVKNSDARDSDFWRISSELEAQAPEGFLPRRTPDQVENAGNDSFLFNSVDRVFFCGDLNYRIDLPRELAEFKILKDGDNSFSEKEYVELMLHDQLKKTIAACTAFPGFAEGKIAFSPTFKFDKETASYDTSHKQRIPAWTDRILFKPLGTRVLEYSSVPDAQHSDHRPVYGTFRVSMEGKDLPQRPRGKSRKQRSKKRSDGRD